jgi:rhodanese-related sulfurtransferase
MKTVRSIALLLIAALMLTGCRPQIMDGPGMVRELTYTQISQDEAKKMMEKDGSLIVDVRRPDEFAEGHIPGAVNVPNENITTEPPEELPDLYQTILVYCRSGRRSKEASQKLADMGYSNVYEFGGIIDWTGEITAKEDVKMFLIDYSGQKALYENARDYYAAGETVTLCYPMIATDTDYQFLLDGESVNFGYDDEKGFIITFSMPEKDVLLECVSRNSMIMLPPAESSPLLYIDGTEVPVIWEDNASVEALRELIDMNGGSLVIQMRMYGGFEQVGPLGKSIESSDVQTTTYPGDIVLYSGDQIVVFYGSNSWAYTMLGRIDLPEDEIVSLLGSESAEIILTD